MKKSLKVLKWMGICFVILLAVMVVFATQGLDRAMNLSLQTVDLNRISDGLYTGAYEDGRWSNTVAVTVSSHVITGIQALKVPQGRASLSAELTAKVITAQSPAVDAVGGATASSRSYLKAVETALLSGVR